VSVIFVLIYKDYSFDFVPQSVITRVYRFDLGNGGYDSMIAYFFQSFYNDLLTSILILFIIFGMVFALIITRKNPLLSSLLTIGTVGAFFDTMFFSSVFAPILIALIPDEKIYRYRSLPNR
jgi:hypothetical protein